VATSRKAEIVSVAGREVVISNPEKLLFPEPRHTKLDLARYYLAVAAGALRGAGGRPNMLVRYLPEARPQKSPALDRSGGAALPVGKSCGGGRAA
jgi:hypothetical protein